MARKDTQFDPSRSAEEKYAQFKSVDPFPLIQPALLNSADIDDYVYATGMIDPYDPNDRKSASYAARIGGEVVLWDGNGKLHESRLDSESDVFELPPNSIAFVEIGHHFRLPEYIAARFNLTITNIYRGLLVGTGPLIDPGFSGKIFLPLHNLTSNPYKFRGKEKLIWVEFTKLSPVQNTPKPRKNLVPRQGSFVGFPPPKLEQELIYYLQKASPGEPIRSSIPVAISASQSAAESASKSARRTTLLTAGGVFLTVTLGILPLLLATWDMHASFTSQVQDLREEVWQLQQQVLEEDTVGLPAPEIDQNHSTESVSDAGSRSDADSDTRPSDVSDEAQQTEQL